jgi:hypothetical protein
MVAAVSLLWTYSRLAAWLAALQGGGGDTETGMRLTPR